MDIMDLFLILGIGAFVIASVCLILPNVSNKLKVLEGDLTSGLRDCCIFWGLYVFASVLLCNAPENEGLFDKRNCSEWHGKGFFCKVIFTGSCIVCKWICYRNSWLCIID